MALGQPSCHNRWRFGASSLTARRRHPSPGARSLDEGLAASRNKQGARHGALTAEHPPIRSAALRIGKWADQPTQTRALRNMRIQPASSCQASGRQEFCTARNTRSGCGIMMVTRPSRVVRPVMPFGEPFGLAG